MAKSLLDQQTQVRGTTTFDSTMYNDYAEQCGRDYDSGSMSTVSGSATMNGSGFSDNFEKDEVGNFVVIDSGDAAGAYKITAVNSTTQVTVSPVVAGTDASAVSRLHYHKNLEDDLNYVRYQLDAVIGETNWYDDPAYSISGLDSEITSVSGSLASDIASGDAATLSGAQSYTDVEISTLSGTLQTAIEAQDEFVELSDTPSEYIDTKLVMSTADAIEYTTDLTWNDSTNALTITSGTFGFSDQGTTINEISIDGTLVGDSDNAVPTEAAVKTYVDTSISAGTDALDFYKTISDGVDSFDAAGNDDILTFNGAGGIIVSAASGTQTVTISGAADFIGLTDTPASYISSNAGYMVRVNDTYDGLDFESTIITDVSGNTTIYGDLSVSGTVFYVDHETVQVSDNIITVNYGEVGVGVTNIYGGIEVDRGTLENYWFVFDETDDWFKIGTSGTLQPVATRGAALTDTYIPFGDADSSYTESSDFTYNDSTKALDINGSVILSTGTSVNEFSTDTTLSGSSNNAVPTENAVKTYVDGVLTTDVVHNNTLSKQGGTTDEYYHLTNYAHEKITAASGSIYIGDDNNAHGLGVWLDGPAPEITIDFNANPVIDLTEDSQIVGLDTNITIDQTIDRISFTSDSTLIGRWDTDGLEVQYGTDINEFSVDTTLSGNSDMALPTERAVKIYVDVGDSSTLSSANSYADGIGTSANGYTDTQLALQDTFIEMGDTPAGYDDTKLVMSTGAAIVYTTDITWNDSTNTLTITSGTFGFDVGTTVNEISTDTTMAGDSDDVIATEHAIKTYVDVATSSISGTVGSLTFLSLKDTPNIYTADRMLFTGASGVLFSSGVTWDETADAMAIAGTIGMGTGTTINEFSTDTTLSGNSDDALPTEKAVKTYVDTGDSDTLSSAQSYADGGDSSTLGSANSYTDTQLALQDTFIEMNDTPAGYDNTKLVMSTGAGIVYTSDLTWNDTTNAMTITSGTLGFSSGTTINEFSTDGTLADASDDAVPTEAAVKNYVDNVASSQDSFLELVDTPAAYTAQQMLFTAVSGVEFAPELTWTGSLMTVSGSLSVLTQLTLASGTAADEISTDITMADNSSTAIVTESAVKGYVDAEILGQQSYNVNMTLSGTTWVYNGGFTTAPDNLVIYLNGVRNKSNDAEYYTSTTNGGILEVEFAYDTFSSDWVTATYGGVQGGIYISRWQAKVDDYQSASNDRIFVDTSATGSNGTPYTITLPANPTSGDSVFIFDAGGDCATTNVTVGRNGSNIMGAAADMDIDVDEASVELVYYNVAGGWRLV